MDELLKCGLLAAMRDKFGFSMDDIGTKTEAEAASQSGRQVIALSTEDIFPHFYDNVLRITAAEGNLAICSSANTSSQPSDEDSISLFVNTLGGRTIVLEARRSWSLKTLKEAIQDREGIPPNQQFLIHAGRQLVDTGTLRDCGLGNGSTVHVVLRLLGGGFPYYYVDPDSFDPHFDCDFTHTTADNTTFYRGGKQYTRPIGSKRYAVRVLGKYSEDKWLGENGCRVRASPGEWPVAYHGTSESAVTGILRSGFDLSKGTRFAYGRGIYCTPDPPTALGYATSFPFEGRRYRLIFQTRVNPATVSEVKPGGRTGGAYWAVPNGDDIRPYGVCIYSCGRRAVNDPPCSIM